MKKLLIKFHGGIRLVAAEIEAIEDYLFGTGERPPLQDVGVMKTVNYLKNLTTRNGHRNIEDLLGYYEGQRDTVRRMWDDYHQRTNN